MSSSLPATIAPMVTHIKTNLQQLWSRHPTKPTRPLFVAFQGPQGSGKLHETLLQHSLTNASLYKQGKTFLTSKLRDVLSEAPHGLSVAVLSIDDLYLPHSGLVEVATAYPHNKLLAGRGQPGTHDVPLGTKLLNELRTINEPEKAGTSVRFPAFEKSLFGGEGDRVEEGIVIEPPVDVVILEGWCVGFCPIKESEIDTRYESTIPDLQGILDLKSFQKENILEINAKLWEYVEWWSFFDCFIQVRPPEATPYSFIYKWRLQQEHNMKAKNGGKGMSDEQVKTYVKGFDFFFIIDSFIPLIAVS